jgi:hypothetical protein
MERRHLVREHRIEPELRADVKLLPTVVPVRNMDEVSGRYRE